ARIERVCTVILGKCAKIGVERPLANVVVNVLPNGFPAFDRTFNTELLRKLNRAIECDPGHDLGIGEVLTPAADLPNPFIRLAPDLREMIEKGLLQIHVERTHSAPVSLIEDV